jgi:hypothetical protein
MPPIQILRRVPQQAVCDPATWEGKQVNRASINAVDRTRGCVIDAKTALRHGRGQEQDEQRAHAVIAESLEELGEKER